MKLKVVICALLTGIAVVSGIVTAASAWFPPAGGRAQAAFSGRVSAGKTFVHRFGPDFVFELAPEQDAAGLWMGWTIFVKRRGGDVTGMTIPWRGPWPLFLFGSYMLPELNAPKRDRRLILAATPDHTRNRLRRVSSLDSAACDCSPHRLGASVPARAGELTATFIGNMAFHITDGRVAILTDFPYASGAFGYMQWSAALVPDGPKPLCLVTHAHRDHFAAELAPRFCGLVLGPTAVAQSPGVKELPLGDVVEWEGITIRPLPTPHGALEHYSYLVEWQGLRLHFTGDTGSIDALVRAPALDVAFVSPWLLSALAKAATRLDARQIVTYHHKDAEQVAEFQGRVVPAPGDALKLKSW